MAIVRKGEKRIHKFHIVFWKLAFANFMKKDKRLKAFVWGIMRNRFEILKS